MKRVQLLGNSPTRCHRNGASPVARNSYRDKAGAARDGLRERGKVVRFLRLGPPRSGRLALLSCPGRDYHWPQVPGRGFLDWKVASEWDDQTASSNVTRGVSARSISGGSSADIGSS